METIQKPLTLLKTSIEKKSCLFIVQVNKGKNDFQKMAQQRCWTALLLKDSCFYDLYLASKKFFKVCFRCQMAKHKSLCQRNDTNLHVSKIQILSTLFAWHNIIYNNETYIILWRRGVVVIT